MDKETVIEATRRWIAEIVIELNLCPFAGRVFQAGRIRYVAAEATAVKSLLKELAHELQALASTPISLVETTLLIHPKVLGDFRDYNDFLDEAELAVEDLGLRGVIQIASFHPDYQVAGTLPGAVENYTNRSPYPMLHLLREESITAVANDPDELLEIPMRNIKILRSLGRAKILEMLKTIQEGTTPEKE